jgi:AraC-like DNA-binding protein
MRHACRVIASPWAGIFGTDVDSARQYGRHWHETFAIGIMHRGAHRSMSGMGIVDAHAGDVITSNPGEVHDGRPLGVESRRWRMVYLDPEALHRIWADTDLQGVHLTRPVIRDVCLAAAVRRLLRRLDMWSAAGPRPSDRALACEEALAHACGLALRDHSTARPFGPEPPADVAGARDRLADDLRHPPALADLAQLAGVSKYRFLRRFQRVYGLTPYEWLRQFRVERARAAIRRGASLAEVAADCGFADQSHMTRAFNAQFGFTPGAWRRACNPVQDAAST